MLTTILGNLLFAYVLIAGLVALATAIDLYMHGDKDGRHRGDGWYAIGFGLMLGISWGIAVYYVLEYIFKKGSY